MKNSLLIVSLFISYFSYSQDAIDNLFQKYKGKDGFTSVYISKDLLQFVAEFDDDKDLDAINGKLSDLKILISEVRENDKNIGFTDEIKSLVSNGSFMNMMEVIDGKDKINFYVKKEGEKIIHLIMIAQNHDDEVLLSIKGDFTTRDLIKLGRNSGHHSGLDHLQKLEKVQ